MSLALAPGGVYTSVYLLARTDRAVLLGKGAY